MWPCHEYGTAWLAFNAGSVGLFSADIQTETLPRGSEMPRRLAAEFFGTVLVDVRRLRERGACRGIPAVGDRVPRSCVGLRPDSVDHGVCGWSHLRRAFQLCCHHWVVGRWSIQSSRCIAIYRCSSDWRNRGRGGAVSYCQRKGWVGAWRVCLGRLWRTQPREVQRIVVLFGRGACDIFLPLRHPRRYVERRRCRVRRYSHWALPHARASVPDPGHERIGESSKKHWTGFIRWQRLRGTTLVVLAGANPRRGDCRPASALAAPGPCLRRNSRLNRFRLVGQRKGPSRPRSSRASQSEMHGRSVCQAANLSLAPEGASELTPIACPPRNRSTGWPSAMSGIHPLLPVKPTHYTLRAIPHTSDGFGSMRKLHSLSAFLPSQADVDTKKGVEVEAACAASTPLLSSILYFLRHRQQVPRPLGGGGLDHALGRVVGVAVVVLSWRCPRMAPISNSGVPAFASADARRWRRSWMRRTERNSSYDRLHRGERLRVDLRQHRAG